MMNDVLTRFVFDEHPIRGTVIRLDDTWREILRRTEYPPALQKLLGELTAAAGLLISTLKFEGYLTLQMQGSGHVRLLVVEVSSELAVRATAKWDNAFEGQGFTDLVGDGQLVVTLSPTAESQAAYQGVVPLMGGKVADALMHYMMQSEQIDSMIVLAANERSAGGLMLQRLPEQRSNDVDAWTRIQQFAASLRAQELLSLDAPLILHRLFHEEAVRLFDPAMVYFSCGCTRERVIEVLKLLGQAELETALEEQGTVTVQCEFCGQAYYFDAVDSAHLWLTATVPENKGHTTH